MSNSFAGTWTNRSFLNNPLWSATTSQTERPALCRRRVDGARHRRHYLL